TEKPYQQIHVVARLVHEDATVVGPGAPPRILVVIGLIPRPTNANAACHQLPEAPGFQRFSQLDDWHIEPVLLHYEQPHSRLGTTIDHYPSIPDVQGHRFLDHDVATVTGQRHDVLRMQSAWCQNADNVDRPSLRTHHLMQVEIAWHPARIHCFREA